MIVTLWLFTDVGNGDGGPLANGGGPEGGEKNVGGLRALERLRVIEGVEREVLLLGYAADYIGVELAAESDDADPFGGLGYAALAEVVKVLAEL